MKHKISDALWLAANRHLAKNQQETNSCAEGMKQQYSCVAVEDACYMLYPMHADTGIKLNRRVLKFLRKMGLDTDSLHEFREFEREPDCQPYYGSDWDVTKASQGARYAWLMFAYDRALEEGK